MDRKDSNLSETSKTRLEVVLQNFVNRAIKILWSIENGRFSGLHVSEG
jgi:hypothetical protein